MSRQDYLAFDERSPSRREHVAGEAYMMTGATMQHDAAAGSEPVPIDALGPAFP